MKSFRVIDSHTGGEPTRTIVSGGPDLGVGSVAQRLVTMRERFDGYRRSLVNEPRGSDVMVGAILIPATSAENQAGVIFFNNVGYLAMCGHGTIGVVETLRYLGQVQPGTFTLETCVGLVRVELNEDGAVTIENVASHRVIADQNLDVPEIGNIQVDIAYGGNWFCLVHPNRNCSLDAPVTELLKKTSLIMERVRRDYPQVDHVELFGPPQDERNHSRNFVHCPGGAYDRSPCGTGTSAKLACLASDGKLAPGEIWRQESIIGSVFEASYRWDNRASGTIIPSIRSRAHVNADLQVLISDDDPFAWGLG